MKIIRTLIIFTLLFFAFQINAMAQPDPCTDPEVYCPVDGGVLLLIGAGVLIGAKKAHAAGHKM